MSSEEGEEGEEEDERDGDRRRTKHRFEELCQKLNMDECAKCEAWGSYRSISRNYTLEVSE